MNTAVTPNDETTTHYDRRKQRTRKRDEAILKAYKKEYAKGLRPEIIYDKLADEFYLSPRSIYEIMLRV